MCRVKNIPEFWVWLREAIGRNLIINWVLQLDTRHNDVMPHGCCFNPYDTDKVSQITHPESGTNLLIGRRGR
jgi:hypothetical protein